MATARFLHWGLRRTGAWLLPPPARCPQRALHKQAEGTEFQSIYSLDKLYPESRGSDTAWRVPVSGEGWTEGAFPRPCSGDSGKPGQHRPGGSKSQAEAQKASNDIPLDRLTISYCRSSGPGGQNVNKVNSKAEVRFHLATAEWIAEPVRQRIAITHKNKINRSGELILTSECSRYQFRNLADCLQKIRDMIAEASQPAKEPSKEDAALHRIRIENMNHERLRKKRIHSALKTDRRVGMD
ncbi:large ribosomal subunit protein mL62 isoform X1 [Mustela lutreola]|uniref:large ribosomal subunit protein mL62 isoform X1 n=1 Tax=Mustela lutreola TaxID=9666 RepID=UPI00279776A6|nr:large ribosomal subunit protein mL62 isoform X1 [Mustela lutreola]